MKIDAEDEYEMNEGAIVIYVHSKQKHSLLVNNGQLNEHYLCLGIEVIEMFCIWVLNLCDDLY